MKVVVTGATGFIGRNVVAALRARGDAVVVLTRDVARARGRLGDAVECLPWQIVPESRAEWRRVLGSADAVVNLAGEPVAGARWNDAHKARIRDSRVGATRAVVDALLEAHRAGQGPKVLVSASGVDYYGPTSEPVDESSPAGQGFLAEVCRAWEAEAARAAEGGAREVRLRIGLVLGEGGGALARMERAFRWFVGGPVGSGRQWVSWIHMDDLVALTLDALAREVYQGPVNAVAPEPVQMRAFAAALGEAMHRPSWARVPSFAVKLLMGEMGNFALESKRVLPRAAQRAGFVWRFPEVRAALRDVIARTQRV